MYPELKIGDYFGLDKIGRRKILSIWSDMRAFLQSRVFGSPLSQNGEPLFESGLEPLPAKQLMKELTKLGIRQWQVKSAVVENQVRVVIMYADMARNTDVITNEMASFGWIRARISSSVQIEGLMCRAMDFYPKVKIAQAVETCLDMVPFDDVRSNQ